MGAEHQRRFKALFQAFKQRHKLPVSAKSSFRVIDDGREGVCVDFKTWRQDPCFTFWRELGSRERLPETQYHPENDGRLASWVIDGKTGNLWGWGRNAILASIHPDMKGQLRAGPAAFKGITLTSDPDCILTRSFSAVVDFDIFETREGQDALEGFLTALLGQKSQYVAVRDGFTHNLRNRPWPR